MGNRDNFKRGTSEMLVLYMLKHADMYGYQLTQTIAKISEGDYLIQESTLYPILYRLIERGYVAECRQESTGKRIRKYYHLNDSGIEYLDELIRDYNKVTDGINKIISSQTKGNI